MLSVRRQARTHLTHRDLKSSARRGERPIRKIATRRPSVVSASSIRYTASQRANVPAAMESEMAPKTTVIEPSWEAKYSYSPAVITEGGKTVWLAGHVGFVDDSGASLAGNFDAQTRQAFKNIEKTLARAGGTLKDIVWMTVSVSDGRYSQRFTDIRKEIYRDQFPASTLLTAAAFAVPEIMVEITAIAVLSA